jgi:hypothetical protein
MTPLEFLQAVYEDDRLPLTTRMRAAAEAAPYMHPKLAVIANLETEVSAISSKSVYLGA